MDSCLIWRYIGLKPKIMRSLEDGSQQTVLYSTHKQPFHLTIDIKLKRYFFFDRDSNLQSIDYQGGDEQSHFQSKKFFHNIKSAVIYGDDIFLLTDSLFYSINKFGHLFNESIVLSQLSSSNKLMARQLYDLKLIDPILQPEVENKCRSAECSHLCLPSDETQVFRCFCPKNYVLINNTICVQKKFKDLILESMDWGKDLQLLINHSISKSIDLRKLLNKSIENTINETPVSGKDYHSIDLTKMLNKILELKNTSNKPQNDSKVGDHFLMSLNLISLLSIFILLVL